MFSTGCQHSRVEGLLYSADLVVPDVIHATPLPLQVTCGEGEVEARIEAQADEVVAALERRPQDLLQVRDWGSTRAAGKVGRRGAASGTTVAVRGRGESVE